MTANMTGAAAAVASESVYPTETHAAAADLFAIPDISLDARPDGTLILKSRAPLPEAARALGVWLERWGREAPDRVFLAERPAPGADWREITYGEARTRVRAIAAGLLRLGLGPDRPIAILSENAIDHALIALAAMHAGIPAATISPAYSLIATDRSKLRQMIALIEPGLVYVSDATQFRAALDALDPDESRVVVASRIGTAAPDGVMPFSALCEHADDDRVQAAFLRIEPDTVARYLFTSGSTGTPKAVINTHRMLTSNQESKAAVWPFLNRTPPRIVDWLPWSHTFGANHNFNMVLRNGGSLYIDGGRPMPGAFQTTIDNIKCVRPNMCFNVPRGYDMLVESLRADEELRSIFFGSVDLVFYAAAALPQSLWNALSELSHRTIGSTVPLVSAWGSTETAPLATDCHFTAERSGNIGVPVPGVTLKLVPSGSKLEIRVKGPNVTPGYFRNPEQTAKAFDEEGFYCIGDAVRLADPQRPEAGLYFDGRVAEDFKLMSGTWVNVGDVRIRGIAALQPLAQDIVVTGHDTEDVGFLIFPNMAVARRIAGLAETANPAEILDHTDVRSHVARGLAALKAEGGGSSRFAARARLLAEPPSIDAGEITDKGYINQRAVLNRRQSDVAALQGSAPLAFIVPAAP
jgi:feruloyl-CoA synthase